MKRSHTSDSRHSKSDRGRVSDPESKRAKDAGRSSRPPVGVVGCSETFDYTDVDDSRHTCNRVLSWFVSPLTLQTFQSDVRDKKHFRSERRNAVYFAGLFSRASFMELIDRKKLEYDKHIVARKSQEPAVSAEESAGEPSGDSNLHHFCRKGIARTQAIEKALGEGYAVELLRPQQYGGQLWRLCSWLEEAMGSPSGCNVCLLPPGTARGETAHEDSDNFMLQVCGSNNMRLYTITSVCQIEGCTRWTIFEDTRASGFQLQRFGLQYSAADAQHLKPVDSFKLSAGDYVYLPRGCIYRVCGADCAEEILPLMCTLSFSYRTSILDFMGCCIARAMSDARASAALQGTWHRDVSSFLADAAAGGNGALCSSILQELMSLAANADAKALVKNTLQAAAADMLIQCLSLRLPLHVPPSIKRFLWEDKGPKNLTIDDEVRLVRRGIAVAALDDSAAVVYHCCRNERSAPAHDLQPRALEYEPDMLPVIRQLFSAYPAYTSICDISGDLDDSEKVAIAQSLYSEGVLMCHRSATPSE